MASFLFALIALGILAYGILEGVSPELNQQQAVDNVTSEQAPTIPQHIVSTDRTTWPVGNKIWDCCRAVAIAEGYNVSGSNPSRLNNPGDISDGASEYGSEQHSGSNVTSFPSPQLGWQWLYTKIQRAASGQSSVYDPSMSWSEIGALWAPPNADVWASNVTAALGVDPDSSLGDYVNS